MQNIHAPSGRSRGIDGATLRGRGRAALALGLTGLVMVGCTGTGPDAHRSDQQQALPTTIPSDATNVLQSVQVQMGQDGAIGQVDSTAIANSGDASSGTTVRNSWSGAEAGKDLPVRVQSAWRMLDGSGRATRTGTDLRQLGGHTGRVQIDLTVQNLTVRPTKVSVDVAGRAQERTVMVGVPLSVVASTSLPGVQAASVVTPNGASTRAATNGVLSQGPKGETVVQWATLLAPPRTGASTTLRLVVDAKDFTTPTFDLGVQPGLVADTSLGSLLDASMSPQGSRELELQRQTVELVGQVNTVLGQASTSITTMRDNLQSTSRTLGTQTARDMAASSQRIASSMQQLDGQLTALKGNIASSMDSTNQVVMQSLAQTVELTDRMLGDTNQAPAAPRVTGNGCQLSTSAPTRATTAYGNLMQVVGALDVYARVAEGCRAQVRQQVAALLGPANPAAANACPDPAVVDDRTPLSVTCSMHLARERFDQTVAEQLETDGQAAVAALQPELMGRTLESAEELSRDVDALVAGAEQLQVHTRPVPGTGPDAGTPADGQPGEDQPAQEQPTSTSPEGTPAAENGAGESRGRARGKGRDTARETSRVATAAQAAARSTATLARQTEAITAQLAALDSRLGTINEQARLHLDGAQAVQQQNQQAADQVCRVLGMPVSATTGSTAPAPAPAADESTATTPAHPGDRARGRAQPKAAPSASAAATPDPAVPSATPTPSATASAEPSAPSSSPSDPSSSPSATPSTDPSATPSTDPSGSPTPVVESPAPAAPQPTVAELDPAQRQALEQVRAAMVDTTCQGTPIPRGAKEQRPIGELLAGQTAAWAAIVEQSAPAQSPLATSLAQLQADVAALQQAIDAAEGERAARDRQVAGSADEVTQLVARLKQHRTELVTQMGALKTQQDGLAKDVEEAFARASANSRTAVDASVDLAVRRASAQGEVSSEALDAMFAAAAEGLGSASGELGRNAAEQVAEQRRGIHQAADATRGQVSEQLGAGLAEIARTVGSSTRDTQAANVQLAQDMKAVLLDLGTNTPGGRGLLGAMSTSAATANTTSASLAQASTRVTEYGNLRNQDVMALLTARAQDRAATQAQEELPAFKVVVPPTARTRTVYTFHIGS